MTRPLCALALVAAVAACGDNRGAAGSGGGAAAPDAGVAFSAEQVRHGGVRWEAAAAAPMAETVELPGRLTPNEDRTARLSAPARGRVTLVHVQFGDRVAAGEPLVTLQSLDAAAARADHDKALAERASRQAAATYARTALERAERLLAVKAMARQDVERARADNELARATLAQADAEVARTRAALAQLGVDSVSGAMVIRAPLAGVVLSRDAAPGSVVDAGAPLITVADVGTLWLEVAATEAVAPALRAGARVRFTVPAFRGDTFTARVLTVSGALDSATRTLPVRAFVPNGDGRLRPQMFATALVEGAVRSAVIVPDSAVQLLDELPVVFVARPDAAGGARFEARRVEAGARLGGRTQVVRGVQGGDLVVVAGAFAVKSEFARAKMARE